MKPVMLAALLPFLAVVPTAPAITLAPGQSATPDALPFYAPNEVDVTGGADATLIAYPGISVAGYYSFGVAQNTLNNNTSYNFHISLSAPPSPHFHLLQRLRRRQCRRRFHQRRHLRPLLRRAQRRRRRHHLHLRQSPNLSRPVLPIADANFILRTDAPDFAEYFQSASLSFVDSSLPGGNFGLTLNAIAPAPSVTKAPVPELSSLSLLTLAFAALAVRYRRRLA